MGKNNKSKEADNSATINKSTSRIITCRCCLSEADDEVTDFLPLDAVATISVRCENDGAANDDGESSSCVPAIAAATLLDCLNGCARIGATLEDSTLPLHICIDCSQALEACCEFIRCVQNADQILRSKRRKTTKIAQMADRSNKIDVVDPVILATAVTSNLDDYNLVSAASIEEQVIKHTKSLPIESLNLMDLIDDDNVNNNCQMMPTHSYNTTLQKANGHQTISKKDSSTSNFTTNASIIRPLEPNNDQNSFRSSNLPLNAMTRIDFDFHNASKSSKIMQDLHSETVNATNLSNDEATHFINLNILSTKDCEALNLSAHTVQIMKQNDILNTHKFIPPFDKDNNTNRDEKVSKKLPIINIDFRPKSIQCDGKGDSTPVNDIKSVKYSTLECDERKYIVNAALVKDLVKFHLENKGKQKYICMFCKFMCNNKQMWDQHLAVHLGAPRYKCLQCNFECRFKYYLTQHLKKVHRMLTTEMQLKPKVDDVSISWTKHYCGLCRSYFTSFIALQQHHHIDEEPYFKCTHCQLSETKRENLMEHLAMEHKVFIDAQFIVAYIPNSLYPTIKSDETNVNKIFLNQFIRFHPKEPKFTVHLCQYCGKSFQRRFHLLKHEHYVHPNDNKKENEKYFKRRTTKHARQQYMRHLRATQAEHQFKCDICHGVFKTLAERSAHVHQQHNTYFQCITCEATFVFEFELKYHMRTHNTRTSSTLTSPRYDHQIETSNSISEELKDRLYQLRQQKQNKKITSSNSMRKRSRPITKRRLSLASVSTTKSSESSVNSPSNTNSDEDMPSIGSNSSKIVTTLNRSDINIAAISVADVMLPQPTQRATTMRRLSTSSIVSLSKFCATSYTSSTLPPTLSQEPPCTSSEKNFNCDFGEQPYLTDFDLNLLDCSNDFLLDFSSM